MGLFMSLILLDCGFKKKEIKLGAQHICVINSIMKSKVVQNMINVASKCYHNVSRPDKVKVSS